MPFRVGVFPSFRFRFGLPSLNTMGKDLRTIPTLLRLHKYPAIDGTAWDLHDMQPFFPPLELLFKTHTVSNLSSYGVRLTDELQKIVDADHVQVKGRNVPIHRKTTMILSPFKWMRGDYGAMGLPKPEEVASDLQEKLQSPHTAGYVGALTSILLSESGCVHFPKVYGVFVGLAGSHTIDISDDYEDLSERRWFDENLGKTFELKLRTPEPTAEFRHTRGQRAGIHLGEEITLNEFQDLAPDHVSEPNTRRSISWSAPHTRSSESEFLEDEEEDDDEFEIHSCGCDSEDEDEDQGLDDEGDEEPFAWATFKNVPVITTAMETCEGTYYDLLDKDADPQKHAAWVAQIVFALAFAQRNFGFTHNDLHGNNVMYVTTDKEYLYYKHDGAVYRLPTYGYILKIIDFDRAITSVRLIGMKEPRQFVSSQFQPNDEAAGQYNLEPFFVQTQPRIPPNPSFDLCRFATSVFWDMFPDGPTHDSSTHPLFGVFKQWMTQTDGSSVLYRARNPDRHDRYHGFSLYKAIARYCKDSATPRRELAKLAVFRVPSVPLGTPCLAIES